METPLRASALSQPVERPWLWPQEPEGILDYISDSFVLLDREWTYLYVNTSAAASFGTSRDELVGKRIWDVFPPDPGSRLPDLLQRAMDANAPHHFKARGDRTQRWYDLHCYPHPNGLAIFFRDVTESVSAEEKLRKNEERLRFTLESANVGTWDWDLVTGKVEWSDNLEVIHGRMPGSFGGSFESVQEDMVPEDRDAVKRAIAQALEEKTDYLVNYRVVKHDGSIIWVEGKGKAQYDDSGRPVRMAGICTDITERKRAEEALRRSEERFRSLVEASTAIVWTTPASGEFETEQPAWSAFTGQLFEDLAGWGWLRAVHPDDQDRTAQVWRAALADSTLYQIEHRLRRHDGVYRHMLVRAVPILEDGQIREWIGTHLDITEIKEKEEALRRNREELRRLNATLEERVAARTHELAQIVRELESRNRELQDFAYVASHDLKEPLRKIATFADLLRHDYADRLDEQGNGYVARVEDSARHMSDLLNDLLAFSRIAVDGESTEEVDLHSILTGVLADLHALIQETGGRIEIGTLCRLEAHPVQVKQLLHNLIGNGLKFRRPGVAPVVRVEAVMKTASDGEGSGTTCVLSVSDNGIGFDPKYADRIFVPFQRLHPRGRYEGTGIGLTICRRIAERHGGRVWATSVPGEGSTFTVELPVRRSGPKGRPAGA